MRPKLDKDISIDDFHSFYWLKKELLYFCKKYSIPSLGSKDDLVKRISYFLKTGCIEASVCIKKNVKKYVQKELSLDSVISLDYKNDRVHRDFFTKIIGKHFRYTVPFIKWMKENSDKTFREAVNEWKRLLSLKKSGIKSSIGSQFQYNKYIRDFFVHNPNHTMKEAIACWKYKKLLPGPNKYEEKDKECLV